MSDPTTPSADVASSGQTGPDWEAIYEHACRIDAADHLLAGRSGWGISRIAYKAVLHALREAGLLTVEPPPFVYYVGAPVVHVVLDCDIDAADADV